MEERPAWPLNQWLLPGLLKRGTQASASEENQSTARPSFFSPAARPSKRERGKKKKRPPSQGRGASGRRIWATPVNTWRRSPLQRHADGLRTPKSSLQAFTSPERQQVNWSFSDDAPHKRDKNDAFYSFFFFFLCFKA